MPPLYAIALVMLVSGMVGGMVNYFLSDKNDSQRLQWWQHMLVGVVASFIVPLFLSMASGDLIERIQGSDGHPPDYAKLFVLAGFCLVASASSRAFIGSISDRVLQQAREATQIANVAQQNAAQAKAAVAPLMEGDGDDSNKSSPMEGPPESMINPLNQNQQRVIHALATGGYTFRSLTGIAQDTGLDKATVNSVITDLLNQKFIAQGVSTTGQPRWYLTPEGRRLCATMTTPSRP